MDNPVLRALGPLEKQKMKKRGLFFFSMEFCSLANSHFLHHCVQGNNKQQQLVRTSRQELTQRGKKEVLDCFLSPVGALLLTTPQLSPSCLDLSLIPQPSLTSSGFTFNLLCHYFDQ